MPLIHPVRTLADWLRDGTAPAGMLRGVLSLAAGSRPLLQVAASDPVAPLLLVHGPEGGLSPQEEQALLAQGYAPVTLGPRVLRAETAAIAALAAIALAGA